MSAVFRTRMPSQLVEMIVAAITSDATNRSEAMVKVAREFNREFPLCDDPNCKACQSRAAMAKEKRNPAPQATPAASEATEATVDPRAYPTVLSVHEQLAAVMRDLKTIQRRYRPGSPTAIYLEACMAGVESASLMAARTIAG